MPPDRRKYLWDALAAADLLSEFSAGRSFEDYRAGALLRSAVEFEIIGEALNQLSKVARWTRSWRQASPTCAESWRFATS